MITKALIKEYATVWNMPIDRQLNLVKFFVITESTKFMAFLTLIVKLQSTSKSILF